MAADTATVTEVASIDRVYHVTAVFVVVTSLVGLVAALAGVFHAAQVLLLSLLLTGALAWKTRLRDALRGRIVPRWSHVLLLIVVTLFFRLPAYNYVLGGQDEGLYTNIAQYIARTGGIKVHDDVAEQLRGTSYLERYLQENRASTTSGGYYALPGIYSDPADPADLEFQFYHLFPVWMALFASVFGSAFGVYALTFFALLSILFFYRLALVLTSSHSAAMLAALLLSLSPLHAFFSKFPVTEVPALAFTLIGFTYVAGYWSTGNDHARLERWLSISVLAFLCMFTTRMSGFTYMPFFVALGIAALVCDPDSQRRRGTQLWAAGVVAVFLLSAVYGFLWDYRTVVSNYASWFRPYVGPHWLRATIALVVAGLVLWAAVTGWVSRSETRRTWSATRVLAPIRIVIGPLTIAVVAAGTYFAYRLGWTSRYLGTTLDSTYHLADAGWAGAVATSLPQLAIFLGPLLVIAFLIGMCRRWPDPRLDALRLFLLMFFAYAMLLRWVLPYNPYYARFLLSEVAPYLILFVVCVWAALRKGTALRTTLTVCILVSLGYAGVLSAGQIGKNEQAGLRAALARLVAPVGSDDIILLDVHDAGMLKTPLAYTFGRQTVTVDRTDLTNAGYVAALAANHANTWLVTSSAGVPDAFSRIYTVRYRVIGYRHDHFAPLSLVSSVDQPLFLYQLTAPRLPLDVAQALNPNSLWASWLVRGWSGPEPWGTWSDARTALLRIDPRELPVPSRDGLVLRVEARAFVVPQHPCQQVIVAIDDVNALSYRPCYPNGQFEMDLPISAALIADGKPIQVTFELPDAKSPQALGLSEDNRTLGIGLTGVTARVAEAVH